MPQVNFTTNNFNFHWRWWDQIQATFLNLFYFKSTDKHSKSPVFRLNWFWYLLCRKEVFVEKKSKLTSEKNDVKDLTAQNGISPSTNRYHRTRFWGNLLILVILCDQNHAKIQLFGKPHKPSWNSTRQAYLQGIFVKVINLKGPQYGLVPTKSSEREFCHTFWAKKVWPFGSQIRTKSWGCTTFGLSVTPT